jgi:hypothetical protein
MLRWKKSVLGIVALATLVLGGCSGDGRQDADVHIHSPDLKHSFALRQGRFSAVTCMAADDQGHVYAAGFSDENCVLMKLDPELKTLIAMVRFGSTQGGGYFSQDTIKDMAIDSHNNIFVTGYTQNRTFPVTKGCYDDTMSTHASYGNYEAFVTKFSPDLKLLAATFIGGEYGDKAYAIAIDGQDHVYVAGYSEGASRYKPSFVPPAGAYDAKPAPSDQSKAMVAKLSNDLGTLMAATLLGGSQKKYESDDVAYDLAIDAEGHVWVAGQTQSADFPVTREAFGRKLAGESDAFVSTFDADLQHLLASTYIGGGRNERANAVLADGQGHVFVGGWSDSADMLLFLEGYDTAHSRNEEDVFIVKLDRRLHTMVAGTFLGGDGPADAPDNKLGPKKDQKADPKIIQGEDKLSCMLLSEDGRTLYAAGRTESRDFDTTPPSRKSHYGNMVFNVTFDRSAGVEEHADPDYGDGFIARFDTTLSTRISATLFGGSSLDYIDDILIRGDRLYLSGETHSVDFPGMPLNYTINATRGFVSCLDKAICRKYPGKKPMVFKPQFSDAEIQKIADALLEDLPRRLSKNKLYSRLGQYAKDRISRKAFQAKMSRALYLYGEPFAYAVKFHHYNYYQDGADGYDWIELCYVEQNMPQPWYPFHTPTGARIVLTIIAKNKKWELADVDYRGFATETERTTMQRRRY